MEARLRTLGAMRIVQGTESRPNFTPPLDSGERRELRDYDARVDSAAGEIWDCVEREQQTHAIRDDPEAMWRKLESVHMQKHPGTTAPAALNGKRIQAVTRPDVEKALYLWTMH